MDVETGSFTHEATSYLKSLMTVNLTLDVEFISDDEDVEQASSTPTTPEQIKPKLCSAQKPIEETAGAAGAGILRPILLSPPLAPASGARRPEVGRLMLLTALIALAPAGVSGASQASISLTGLVNDPMLHNADHVELKVQIEEQKASRHQQQQLKYDLEQERIEKDDLVAAG
ncbi:hypothetical protein LTR37_008967 [Vermiconidia calcicola]|uniref:Uncharacterized protein n=1 Tax=Vermiconidia calcicola TaxID=1690605 RepID=A0ACC3N963_9PEZI|nr:hypothetical protein LTR37_008967 [Vermiconidia calcicola]